LETSHSLRQTSDELLRDLDVLTTLEEQKRGLDPGDPKLVELAGRIETIAERVLVGSIREHQLTKVANEQVEAEEPAAPTLTIDETPARPVAVVLAEWREAERRMGDLDPDSAEADEARALVDALRAEYRRAYEAARHS
jgi:hypothetical protein